MIIEEIIYNVDGKTLLRAEGIVGHFVIPDGVTAIGSMAFCGCSGLTSVTIPDSVTKIGANAFFDVRNIIYSNSAAGAPWGAESITKQ